MIRNYYGFVLFSMKRALNYKDLVHFKMIFVKNTYLLDELNQPL